MVWWPELWFCPSFPGHSMSLAMTAPPRPSLFLLLQLQAPLPPCVLPYGTWGSEPCLMQSSSAFDSSHFCGGQHHSYMFQFEVHGVSLALVAWTFPFMLGAGIPWNCCSVGSISFIWRRFAANKKGCTPTIQASLEYESGIGMVSPSKTHREEGAE
jgi:hypothetical protein